MSLPGNTRSSQKSQRMKNDVIYSDYSDEFKKELKKRVNYYLEGGKMIDPNEINQRIAAIKRKRKK